MGSGYSTLQPELIQLTPEQIAHKEYLRKKKERQGKVDIAKAFDYRMSPRFEEGAKNIPPVEHSMVNIADESCLVKSTMSVVAGGAMGLVMGLFMSSATNQNYSLDPEVQKLSTKEQIRLTFKEMGNASRSYARNFAGFGLIYSAVECNLEKVRGKKDISSAALSGCITGGLLGIRGGPIGASIGCGGCAFFSAGIEWYMEKY